MTCVSKKHAENVEAIPIDYFRDEVANSDSGKPSYEIVFLMFPEKNDEVALSRHFRCCNNNYTMDPVADFLASEQKYLADIGDFEDATEHQQQPHQEEDFNEVTSVDNSNFDLQGLAVETPSLLSQHGSTASFDSLSATNSRYQEEPETLKKWKEQNEKLIAEKDQNENKKKDEWKVNGRKELEQWYSERDAKLQAVKVANRKGEQELISGQDEPCNKDHPNWKRIASLCDLTAKSTRDVSRMRSLLASM
uniref:Clathrin light chain n=1 Tax=Rhabditophanes sp. KR3021 TaxID=114890 RepID=A0AC35UGR0_9BILA